jgi:hypothetical protein
MSQRFSGRARQDRESYPTPAWVTAALVPHLRPYKASRVWEPAAGDGQMADALRVAGLSVTATDILDGHDFLNGCREPAAYDSIVTNPPYGLGGRVAQQFIERALQFTKPKRGAVAMLLKVDFDSASTRRHLFAGCPAFARKVVLTERIVWFEPAIARPSENHSWFVWSWRHRGPPTVAYAP